MIIGIERYKTFDFELHSTTMITCASDEPTFSTNIIEPFLIYHSRNPFRHAHFPAPNSCTFNFIHGGRNAIINFLILLENKIYQISRTCMYISEYSVICTSTFSTFTGLLLGIGRPISSEASTLLKATRTSN